MCVVAKTPGLQACWTAHDCWGASRGHYGGWAGTGWDCRWQEGTGWLLGQSEVVGELGPLAIREEAA